MRNILVVSLAIVILIFGWLHFAPIYIGKDTTVDIASIAITFFLFVAPGFLMWLRSQAKQKEEKIDKIIGSEAIRARRLLQNRREEM